MLQRQISPQTLRRLPRYLNFLCALPPEATHISATQIAEAVGLGNVQVRKDLAAVSDCGRPKTGYETACLKADIEHLLRCDEPVGFCIVGMGHLGMALAQYQGFSVYGLRLAAVFDTVANRIGRMVGALSVNPLSEMNIVCKARGVQLGVITSPSSEAQAACDALAAASVHTIWNFAPIHLTAPQGIHIEHENMAAQLGALSRHLQRNMENSDNV